MIATGTALHMGNVPGPAGSDTIGIGTACVVPGCTDPTACNYNIEATNDNGSCEYPDNNGDCNTSLDDLTEEGDEIISITDIIGRKITNIKSGQIYLINHSEGGIEKNVTFK